jgi:hypothetical protein
VTREGTCTLISTLFQLKVGNLNKLLLILASTVILSSESCGTTLSQLWGRYNCLSPAAFQLKVKVRLQLTVSQSLCQGIEPILGLVTRYYFLSEGCFLKFAVMSFWGALSDERSGLSFVSLCLVICHYLHQLFTLHVFYSSAIYIQ